jgi:transposase-like protein
MVFRPDAVRDWESQLTSLLTATLRKQPHNKARESWCVDETYVCVYDQWSDLSRAINWDGHLKG